MEIKYHNANLEESAVKLKNLLEKNSKIKLAIIYGSILHSNLIRDIDLAIYTSPPLQLKELLLLADKLEQTIKIPIHLTPINKLPPNLRLKILSKGKPIILKDKKLYNQLAYQALSQKQDLKIKLNQITTKHTNLQLSLEQEQS